MTKQGRQAKHQLRIAIFAVATFWLLCHVQPDLSQFSISSTLGQRYVALINQTVGMVEEGALLDEANSPSPDLETQEEANNYTLLDQSSFCFNFDENVASFTADVRANAEEVALPAWRSKANPHVVSPKLDREFLQSVFRGKHIALVGDSTLFYMQQMLYWLLSPGMSSDFVDSLSTMNLTSANRGINKKATRLIWKEKKLIDQLTSYHDKKIDTFITWKGFRGANIKHNCMFNKYVWDKLKPKHVKGRLDVIVANWGLHMFTHWQDKELCHVHRLLHYEGWLEKTLQFAEEMGVKLLLFKTTNYICHERFFKKDKTLVSELVEKKDPELLRECTDNLQKRAEAPLYNLTKAELGQYCLEGIKHDWNVQRLNQRMREFVAKVQGRASANNMTVAIYDDYSMQSCQHTPDSIHYFALNLPRIRLLAHTIQCLWKEEEEP